MNPHRFDSGFKIKPFVISVSVLLLVFYGIFNARNLLLGPSIEILSPVMETETDKDSIMVKGVAKNITFLSLNARPIFIDTDGLFEEKLLLYPGFNIIDLTARDRFKNEVKKTIRVYYKPSTTTPIEAVASSTEEIIE